jgi:FkbM family methyltransferase
LEEQLAQLAPDVFVDVGANTGDFCRLLRSLGFRGEIIAVEPDPRCLAPLREMAGSDPGLRVVPFAVTPMGGPVTLKLARSSLASSVLSPRTDFIDAWGGATTIAHVPTESVTLNAVISEMAEDQRVAAKIDIQGIDAAVLASARPIWGRLVLVLVEVSHEPLYESEPAQPDLLDRLSEAGLLLVAQYPVCWSLDGRPIQSDVLLARCQ